MWCTACHWLCREGQHICSWKLRIWGSTTKTYKTKKKPLLLQRIIIPESRREQWCFLQAIGGFSQNPCNFQYAAKLHAYKENSKLNIYTKAWQHRTHEELYEPVYQEVSFKYVKRIQKLQNKIYFDLLHTCSKTSLKCFIRCNAY